MVNLLPPSFRRQQIIRRRSTQWSTVICLVLLGGWVSHLAELRGQDVLTQQLEVLSREHEPTQNMLKHLVEMRQQLENLQQQESIARELEYQRNPLSLLGIISRTAAATKERLRVTKFELTDFQSTRRPEAPAGDAPAPQGLLLSGVSLDNPSVAEFVGGLQDSKLFGRVELVGIKEREEGTSSLRDYEIRCEF
jgi:hypothetical protein